MPRGVFSDRWSGGGGAGAAGHGGSAAQCCGSGVHDLSNGGQGAFIADFAGVTTTDDVALDGYFGGGGKGSQQCTCGHGANADWCGNFYSAGCQQPGNGNAFGGGGNGGSGKPGFFVVRY